MLDGMVRKAKGQKERVRRIQWIIGHWNIHTLLIFTIKIEFICGYWTSSKLLIFVN